MVHDLLSWHRSRLSWLVPMEMFEYDDLPDGFDEMEFEQTPPDGRAETPPEVEQSSLYGAADLHEVPPSERPIQDL